jgi:hypothetical protein
VSVSRAGGALVRVSDVAVALRAPGVESAPCDASSLGCGVRLAVAFGIGGDETEIAYRTIGAKRMLDRHIRVNTELHSGRSATLCDGALCGAIHAMNGTPQSSEDAAGRAPAPS